MSVQSYLSLAVMEAQLIISGMQSDLLVRLHALTLISVVFPGIGLVA